MSEAAKRRTTPDAGGPLIKRVRAGGRALLVLADPVSVSVLRLLAVGPLTSAELSDGLSNVSRSTRFERLRELEGLGLIARDKRGGSPPVTHCRLTPSGGRLLPVAAHLGAWLASAPGGPLKLGEATATAPVKALALCWGSRLFHSLAERPRSLSELEGLLGEVGYREIERALRNLIEVGLAERVTGERRLRPYAMTRWASEAIVPLAVAARWERGEIPQLSAPVTAADAEGVMLLALSLVEREFEVEDDCLLLIDAEAPDRGLGSVAVRSGNEGLVSYPIAEPHPGEENWMRGSAWAWLHAVAKGRAAALRVNCDLAFAQRLIGALHRALSGSGGRLLDSCLSAADQDEYEILARKSSDFEAMQVITQPGFETI